MITIMDLCEIGKLIIGIIEGGPIGNKNNCHVSLWVLIIIFALLGGLGVGQ